MLHCHNIGSLLYGFYDDTEKFVAPRLLRSVHHTQYVGVGGKARLWKHGVQLQQ